MHPNLNDYFQYRILSHKMQFKLPIIKKSNNDYTFLFTKNSTIHSPDSVAAINESLHAFISSLSSKAEAAMSVALDIPLDTIVVVREGESECVREREWL